MLAGQAYLADRGLSTAIYLSLTLSQPLLLEGEAGVGKTEVAKALAGGLGVDLIRLQCYEGIDANQALYEWDYPRQLLYLRRAAEADAGGDGSDDLFAERFLVERPLLQAIRKGADCVLLIDEIDRADDEFEAFLLEILSEFQISIPEIGTVGASAPPPVIITSNRTRELHDALKRRCLYHWIDFPGLEREVEIVAARAPEVPALLARSTSRVVSRLRGLELVKQPGVAETINWARALNQLGEHEVTADNLDISLGSVIKDHDDLSTVRSRVAEMLDGV
ncbi:MAG: MoxR family ATPase [Acidimicrobiia bacterium]|nr:MoxR family ATPase [bacterium]MYB44295.1 MoxR family ATPase [Acidimicrobiia bacterium]MYC85357.1 MoxR family ATPase [Acidimicrobiia bacterium]